MDHFWLAIQKLAINRLLGNLKGSARNVHPAKKHEQKSVQNARNRFLIVVPPRRRGVLSDCSLNAQSLPGIADEKRALTTNHFQPTIAGNSPFRIDGMAKRNRTDHKGQSACFGARFSTGAHSHPSFFSEARIRSPTCSKFRSEPSAMTNQLHCELGLDCLCSSVEMTPENADHIRIDRF